MDYISRRESFESKTVQRYGLLLSKVACLTKELVLEKNRKKALLEETKIQSVVIAHLKSLLKTQTQPSCELGHKWCRMDHKKFNFNACHFKMKTCSKDYDHKRIDTTGQQCDQKRFIAKLKRKTDHLQSKFGYPALQRINIKDDLIDPEFLTI